LRGYAFNDSADFETIRIMKEKLCYVGYDIDIEQKLARETTVLVEQYKVRKLIFDPFSLSLPLSIFFFLRSFFSPFFLSFFFSPTFCDSFALYNKMNKLCYVGFDIDI
jgi:hypothetical protein